MSLEKHKKSAEKKQAIAKEIIKIFHDNHLSFLEIEQTLTLVERIAKSQTYLETSSHQN
ncbi:MAG: hypothetical protein IJ471_01485 [Eubacterium sp.]|nr:hypothetical protein [Eubacterium sp.]